MTVRAGAAWFLTNADAVGPHAGIVATAITGHSTVCLAGALGLEHLLV